MVPRLTSSAVSHSIATDVDNRYLSTYRNTFLSVGEETMTARKHRHRSIVMKVCVGVWVCRVCVWSCHALFTPPPLISDTLTAELE